jgi:hypothetical protein
MRNAFDASVSITATALALAMSCEPRIKPARRASPDVAKMPDAGPDDAGGQPFAAEKPDAAGASSAELSVACRWVDVWHPSMKNVRSAARKLLEESNERATAITCCFLTPRDALCRARFDGSSANHIVGDAIGTRLVGVSAGSTAAWFDVPMEVSVYQTMRQRNPPWDVALTVSVAGPSFALQRAHGTCPRPCAAVAGGCRAWEVDAQKACDSVGSYRLVDGQLQRPSFIR